MKSKIPDDSKVTKAKDEPKDNRPVTMNDVRLAILDAFAGVAKGLEARAGDRASLDSRSGPQTVHGVEMALQHVADVMAGGKKLKMNPRRILKRVPDDAPAVPREQLPEA